MLNSELLETVLMWEYPGVDGQTLGQAKKNIQDAIEIIQGRISETRIPVLLMRDPDDTLTNVRPLIINQGDLYSKVKTASEWLIGKKTCKPCTIGLLELSSNNMCLGLDLFNFYEEVPVL